MILKSAMPHPLPQASTLTPLTSLDAACLHLLTRGIMVNPRCKVTTCLFFHHDPLDHHGHHITMVTTIMASPP